MRIATADEVRAAIAAHMLGTAAAEPRLGGVTLHDHQRQGAERLERLLARHGGALLADDVGLGKTYVALAVARSARAPLVVAPAALRPMWTRALAETSLHADLCSFEMLSRGRRPSEDHDLVIVDEAHHLRSRQTRRFEAAVALCARARVLLITATPVQNRSADLRTLLSLFLGERAFAVTRDELGAYIVRRGEGDVPSRALGLPSVDAPRWIGHFDDTDCLDRLLALPPPLPPADGDDGGVLLTYTLVRQWASSRAALRAALRRRLAGAAAMEDALLAGRRPSRAELRAWCLADGAQQLAFPELIASQPTGEAPALLAQVRAHAGAVRGLLDELRRWADPDDQRATAIQDVQRRHPGERIICFSEYAATVAAFFERLKPRLRCAVLTHAGGRVAGGPIPRAQLLARFAPGMGAREPDRERIDVLLGTDVLSEGVSLQDASVLVHLDLPWNPARLEQRVGRLRRLGATRDRVSVYVMAAPAATERLLDMERRLRAKLGEAARTVGLSGAILPGVARTDSSPSGDEERITALLRRWQRRASPDAPASPVAAGVRATGAGAIACVRQRGVPRLLAISNGDVQASRGSVLALLRQADGSGVAPQREAIADATLLLERWLRRHRLSDVVDLAALRVARARRALLRRVDSIRRRAPRHAMAAYAPMMSGARSAAIMRLSAGAARVLDALARAPMPDDAWLRAVNEFAAVHGGDDVEDDAEILALLLLVPSPRD